MSFRPFCLLGIALLFLVPAPALRAQDTERPKVEVRDLDGEIGTDWYGVYLKGKKVGFLHNTLSKTENEYVLVFGVNMKLLSFGQKVEMAMLQTLKFQNKDAFALLEGEFVKSDNGAGQTVKIKKNDKGFNVLVSAGKEETTRQIGPLDYTLADSMLTEMWLRKKLKPGDKITGRSFDMLELKIEPQKNTFLSSKESLVGGVNVRYFEVESLSGKDAIKMVALYDEKGKLLSGTLGGLFEMRRETEEQAKNTEFSQDLFVLGMAKINRPLGPTKKVTELVIEVDAKEIEGIDDGPRQTATKNDHGAMILKIGKKHGKETKATMKEIEEALAETNSYCISHPKVKALAEEAIGDAKTPQEKVDRIVAFVNGFVKGKYTGSLPNIHDLMKKKEGDCKSYALLTTTLCRAVGVPSREVSGLVYMGDDQKAFGGHAWNEVVLDGVWVPVDASLRETELDAAHISFGNQSQANKAMLGNLGKLSFKLIEVQTSK